MENSKKKEEFNLEDYELNDTDKKVFHFQQQYPELNYRQLSKLLDIEYKHFTRILAKPAYKKAKAELIKTFLQIIIDARHEAARVKISGLHSSDERIRQSVASEILQLDKIELGASEDEQPNF